MVRGDAGDTRSTIDIFTPQALSDAPPDFVAPDARVVGQLGSAESWTGYVEGSQFASGSDLIKFSIAYDSSGQVVGTVIFGNGTPPPPATDPNVGYPPGFNYALGSPIPYEGFEYSIVAGSYLDRRLTFAVDTAELWADWCALQPPPTNGSTTCVPNFTQEQPGPGNSCTITMASGKTQQLDCGKLALCQAMSVCTCSSLGCSTNWSSHGEITIDVFVVGDTASGSMDRATVHFIKDTQPGSG
jgi:hypothetical protein